MYVSDLARAAFSVESFGVSGGAGGLRYESVFGGSVARQGVVIAVGFTPSA